MNYNFTIHATCPLANAFMTYKYSELQVSSTTPKLNCKASCKTPVFLIMTISLLENGLILAFYSKVGCLTLGAIIP